MKINELPFDEKLIGRKFLSLSGSGKIIEIFAITPEGNKTRYDTIHVKYLNEPESNYFNSIFYMNADQELLED